MNNVDVYYPGPLPSAWRSSAWKRVGDNLIEKPFRDAKALDLLEGARQIQRVISARHPVGPASLVGPRQRDLCHEPGALRTDQPWSAVALIAASNSASLIAFRLIRMLQLT